MIDFFEFDKQGIFSLLLLKKRLVVRVLSKKIVSKALKSVFETTQIEFSILQKPKKKKIEAMHFGDNRKYMIVVCIVGNF